MIRNAPWTFLSCFGLLTAVACSDDESSTSGSGGADASSGGSGGSGASSGSGGASGGTAGSGATAGSGGSIGGGGSGGSAGSGAAGSGGVADASVGDAGTNTQDAGPDAPEIGGDVPEDILGVWVGNAVPAVGGYPITVVLAPGATGSVVGISAYPTFPCGGALTLVDGSNVGLTDGGPPDSGSFAVDGSVNLLPSGVVTKETLTWGISNCGNDGNEVFSLRTDGALNWTWESSGYVETGVLSRVGAFGFDVPTSYLGVWLGTVVSDAGDAGDAGPASEGVTAAITVGTSGDVIGAIAYHDTACVGQWTMTASTPDLVVTEAITQGSCADGGTVTLSVSGSSLAYAWRRAGEPTRTGTLSPPVF